MMLLETLDRGNGKPFSASGETAVGFMVAKPDVAGACSHRYHVAGTYK